MKIIRSYTGKIGNAYATVCDIIPENMIIKEIKILLQPDDGKYLLKDGKIFLDSIIIQTEEDAKFYTEVDIPNFIKNEV